MASQQPAGGTPVASAPPSGPSILQVFLGAQGFRISLLMVVVIAAAPFWLDPLFAELAKSSFDSNTERVAQTLDSATAKQMNALMRSNGMAWCYVADKAGKPTSATKDLLPEGDTPSSTAKTVVLDGITYYESVAPTKDPNLFLHAGHRTQAGTWFTDAAPFTKLTTVRLPLLYTIIASVAAALLGVLLTFKHAGNLVKLRRAVPTLLDLDEQSRNDFLARAGGAELNLVAETVKILVAKFNFSVAESLKREHELKKQFKKLSDENARLHADMKENLYQSHVSMSELALRESEDDLLRLVQKDIEHCKEISDVFQKSLDILHSKYPTSLNYCAVLTITDDRRVDISAQIGLDASLTLGIIKHFDAQAGLDLLDSRSSKQLSQSDFERFGLDGLARQVGWQAAIIIPVVQRDRAIGLMIACFDESSKKTMQDRSRVLKSVCDVLASTCAKLLAYNEEMAAARTDAMTGTYNKKYFHETFDSLLKKSSAEHPLSVLMIDGDKFKEINDTYGHQVGDSILKELAKTMQLSTRRMESQKTGRFKDHVIRYGGEEFMIVLENTNKETAMLVAERLRKTVAEKQNWPGGIAKWSISLGVATFPFDTEDANQLIEKADIALYYCKEVLGRNATADITTVPKTFRGKKKATLGGELGVLEPAALLQSLATAQKTGVMTVTDAEDRTFFYSCQSGKPAQARLGALSGDNAVVEFIATFEEGRFNFQERAIDGRAKVLDDTFDVKRSLERCLMDGALAVDNMQWGLQILAGLSEPLTYCRESQLDQLLETVSAESTAITPQEIELIKRMYPTISRGGIKLQEAPRSFPDLPSYMVYRALALMCQAKIITNEKAPDLVAQSS
jgi:diguanylate cyclase (GGDEF)-like protein